MKEKDLNASVAESSINENDEPIIVGNGRNIIRSKTKSFLSGNNEEPVVLGNASSK